MSRALFVGVALLACAAGGAFAGSVDLTGYNPPSGYFTEDEPKDGKTFVSTPALSPRAVSPAKKP
jgi:hypothetical protein